MDWWGWLLIAVIFLLLALLVFSPYFRSGVASAFSNSSSSSNANVRVDVHGNDIDADLLLQERVRTIQRQQYLREDIWNDSRKILKKSAENNRLKNFTAFHDEQGEIFVNANFRRDRRDERRNDSNEERK
jgi:predicted membrane metal-binding protein